MAIRKNRALATKLEPPEDLYARIRRDHPKQQFGSHWEGIGNYCGDDVWCDPKAVDMPGEYEFFYREMRKLHLG